MRDHLLTDTHVKRISYNVQFVYQIVHTAYIVYASTLIHLIVLTIATHSNPTHPMCIRCVLACTIKPHLCTALGWLVMCIHNQEIATWIQVILTWSVQAHVHRLHPLVQAGLDAKQE